jgi:hypothetical protein
VGDVLDCLKSGMKCPNGVHFSGCVRAAYDQGLDAGLRRDGQIREEGRREGEAAGYRGGVEAAATWLGRRDADLAYEMSCELNPELHRISATPVTPEGAGEWMRTPEEDAASTTPMVDAPRRQPAPSVEALVCPRCKGKCGWDEGSVNGPIRRYCQACDGSGKPRP